MAKLSRRQLLAGSAVVASAPYCAPALAPVVAITQTPRQPAR